jgi:hypothetical protein
MATLRLSQKHLERNLAVETAHKVRTTWPTNKSQLEYSRPSSNQSPKKPSYKTGPKWLINPVFGKVMQIEAQMKRQETRKTEVVFVLIFF